MTTLITNFRSHLDGPELAMENRVAEWATDLNRQSALSFWTAVSMRVGAGMPDLAIIGYHAEVEMLSGVDPTASEILAYLRSTGRANPETIAMRIHLTNSYVMELLNDLEKRHVIETVGKAYRIRAIWTSILPAVTAIEIKVSDWKRAITQAAQNRVFCHRSYVALPPRAAERVKADARTSKLGIGVISVPDNDDPSVIKPARIQQPGVWQYYYQLARRVASSTTERYDAV